jgi:cysteine/histidine-rich domain-containing protein 1
MDQTDMTKKMQSTVINGEIAAGTSCKHGGCKGSYKSSASNDESCVYHPGFPIFHEGLKFWTCCQRKTSDFQAFLEQAGCETGKHKWVQEDASNNVNCRWDWHQTAGNVVVAVYAKNYDYKKSFVKVSPVRLIVKIVFPQENNAQFNIDLELRGMIDVAKANARMFGTKIEITLPKAEGGHWVRLDYPREKSKEPEQQEEIKNKQPVVESDNESDVDLDDLEIIHGTKITELASQKVE